MKAEKSICILNSWACARARVRACVCSCVCVQSQLFQEQTRKGMCRLTDPWTVQGSCTFQTQRDPDVSLVAEAASLQLLPPRLSMLALNADRCARRV